MIQQGKVIDRQNSQADSEAQENLPERCLGQSVFSLLSTDISLAAVEVGGSIDVHACDHSLEIIHADALPLASQTDIPIRLRRAEEELHELRLQFDQFLEALLSTTVTASDTMVQARMLSEQVCRSEYRDILYKAWHATGVSPSFTVTEEGSSVCCSVTWDLPQSCREALQFALAESEQFKDTWAQAIRPLVLRVRTADTYESLASKTIRVQAGVPELHTFDTLRPGRLLIELMEGSESSVLGVSALTLQGRAKEKTSA